MDYRTKTECYSLILVKLDLIFWKKGFTEFFVAYLVSLVSCSAGFSGTGGTLQGDSANKGHLLQR